VLYVLQAFLIQLLLSSHLLLHPQLCFQLLEGIRRDGGQCGRPWDVLCDDNM
jgi:hypothetical protein